MSDITEVVIWVFAIACGSAGIGFWGLMMVSGIAAHTAFMRYSKQSQSHLSYFQSYRVRNDMLLHPDKYRTEFETDQTGCLERFLKWRKRLVFGATSFVALILSTWGLIGLIKFFTYIYVKGQQAG